MPTSTHAGKNFTERQLAGLESSNLKHLRGWEGTGRRLIAELRAEKRLNLLLMRRLLSARAQLTELDRQTTPGGRLLVVDCPASDGERCDGETLVYADQRMDVATARVPVGTLHPRYEEVLEGVLAGLPRRFQGMPGDLSTRVRSLTRYPRDLRREVAALVNAKVADNVLAAINQIREEMEPNDETLRTAETQDAAQAGPVPVEANQVEKQVHQPEEIRDTARGGPPQLPF